MRFPVVMPSPDMPIRNHLADKLKSILDPLEANEQWEMVHRIILSYTMNSHSMGRTDYYASDVVDYMQAFGIITEKGNEDLFTDRELNDLFGQRLDCWDVVKNLLARVANTKGEDYTEEMDRATRSLLMSVGWE
jgi:hypothetical protein